MLHIAHRLRRRFPEESRYLLPGLALTSGLALVAGLMLWAFR